MPICCHVARLVMDYSLVIFVVVVITISMKKASIALNTNFNVGLALCQFKRIVPRIPLNVSTRTVAADTAQQQQHRVTQTLCRQHEIESDYADS